MNLPIARRRSLKPRMPAFFGKKGSSGPGNGFSSLESACPAPGNGFPDGERACLNFGKAFPDEESVFFWRNEPFPGKKACISTWTAASRSSETRFFRRQPGFLVKMSASEVYMGVSER